MYFFYNITVNIVGFFLKIVALFNKKIDLFVKGRKDVFKVLENHFKTDDAVIWFHCASLGEFEQGRPIIEKCKEEFKNHKILITFFSPSGYEIRKDYNNADLVTYLPLDTKKNARKFLQTVNPAIAIFVKYEFWPNLLEQLKIKKIKTILVSGIFRKEQSFFKIYGRWMKRSLQTFDHFFVQDLNSKELLKRIHFTNVTVSGDTRFDRVFAISKQNNNLEFAEKFVDGKITLVAGSTWQKDEELLVDYINNKMNSEQKIIIAPHNINRSEITKLEASISKESVLYSEINDKELHKYQVLIIDVIGLLSKIYNYADIAYVGGGFGTGIHNILEPAAFEVPIIIGPNYNRFKEARELVDLNTCMVVTDKSELNNELTTLITHSNERKYKGKMTVNYVLNNVGATDFIVDYLDKHIIKK